jgi:predicted alpha/beta-fold hydrolase
VNTIKYRDRSILHVTPPGFINPIDLVFYKHVAPSGLFTGPPVICESAAKNPLKSARELSIEYLCAMPLLPKPFFKPPFWQFNGHLQTIAPSLFRKVKFDYHQRERLELPDGDFVDLDWHFISPERKKLVIITHGLEGDSRRHYVLGMAKIFTQNGFDALGWNCRSCSGELNRLLRFYHHGDAGDLRLVIDHAIQKMGYEEIVLVGFSMGGSLSLRAVAEFPDAVPVQVKKVVAFSVPCDLMSSVDTLSQPNNKLYNKRFLRKLGEKIRAKEKIFPGQISSDGYETIMHFHDFDNRYTAPLHGFTDAADFYARASVKPLLKNIRVATLIVQALNDTFLSPQSLCYDEIDKNEHIFLETPDVGGHCGFAISGSEFSWADLRAIDWALHKD